MRRSLEDSGQAAAGSRTEGNLITSWAIAEDREVCRIRTCFEDDTLGSELLPPDVLLAERRGILIDAVAPIRLLLFGTGPEIEPITQLAGNLGWVIECFGHPSELAADFRPDATAALVMNHNFSHDLLALDRLLRSTSICRIARTGNCLPDYCETEYRPLDFETGTETYALGGTRHRQRGPRNRARDRFRCRSSFRSLRWLPP